MLTEREKLNLAKVKFFILLGIIVITLVFSIYLYLGGFNLNDIKKDLLAYHNFAPIIFIFFYTVASIIPVPFFAFSYFGTNLFGTIDAFIYSLAGNVIFITLMFFVSRWLGRDYIQILESKNKKAKQLDMTLEKDAFRDILLLRLFFIIPVNAVNIIAGLSKMRFKDYFYASCFGIIPITFVYILLARGILLHESLLVYFSVILGIIFHVIPLIYIYQLRCAVKNTTKKGLNFLDNLVCILKK